MAVNCSINQCDLLDIGVSIARAKKYGIECSEPRLCEFTEFYFDESRFDETYRKPKGGEDHHTTSITKVVRRKFQFTEYACIVIPDTPELICDLDLTILS